MSSENNKHSELTMLRNQKYNIATMEGLGMKWYEFNIYFRLFFAIISLLSDIKSIPLNYGDLWGISWNIDVYLCFAVIFDVILIVGTILTRHWLVYFDKKGVQFYFIIQYLSQVVLIIASLLLLGVNEDTFPQTLGRLIGLGIFFAFEYKYWKKRSHLFSNSNQSTYVYSNKSDSMQIKTPIDNQNINKSEIKFCRKCGASLIDNSKFCCKCGTEIVDDVVSVVMEEMSNCKLSEDQINMIQYHLSCIDINKDVAKNSDDGQAVKKALDGLLKSIDYIMQYEEDELRQAGATKEKLPAQREFIIQHYDEMINQAGK